MHCKVLYIVNADKNNIPTPEEAQTALDEAYRQKERARQVYGAFNGLIFIIWGSVYTTAYTVVHLWPQAEIVWLPLVLIGFFLSYWFGSRIGTFLRSSAGRAYRSLWAAFGLGYFLLGWGFATANAPSQLFSYVVNLFVAYALVASGIATEQSVLVRAGAVLAGVNTLFFVIAPSYYYLAMAALGLLAVVTGLRVVRSEI